jgi:hypothetical protein
MSRQKMPIFNDRRFLAYLLKLGAEHCRERTFLMKLAQLCATPILHSLPPRIRAALCRNFLFHQHRAIHGLPDVRAHLY